MHYVSVDIKQNPDYSSSTEISYKKLSTLNNTQEENKFTILAMQDLKRAFRYCAQGNSSNNLEFELQTPNSRLITPKHFLLSS